MSFDTLGVESSSGIVKDPPHEVVVARMEQCGMPTLDNSEILKRIGPGGKNMECVGLQGNYPVGTLKADLNQHLTQYCKGPDIAPDNTAAPATMAAFNNVPKPPGMSV
jgi:hypothetical protein